MAHRLDAKLALEAAQRAVVTERAKAVGAAEDWPMPDIERGIRSATTAEAIEPPECWRLSGGRGSDGEPLVIEIEVREQTVVVFRVTEE